MDNLIFLAALLSFVFGWNNSAILIGNIRAAGSISYRSSSFLASIGLVAGVLLEGGKMSNSLTGLTTVYVPNGIVGVTLGVSLAVALLLSLLGLPISFSIVIVGSFVGSVLPYTYHLDSGQLTEIVAFWVIAPLLSALISFLIYNSVKKLVSHLGLVEVDMLNRAGIVVAGLSASYSLGANNIGLIEGTISQNYPAITAILLFSAVIGTVAMGGGNVSGSVGDRLTSLSPQGVLSTFIASSIAVWIGTQFALPISISQCLLGGMFGVAFTRKLTVVNRKLLYETVLLWVIAPLICFGIAYILSIFLGL
jgi:phosphate/sulfate permease